MYNKVLRTEILDKDLTRPNWLGQEDRLETKLWLDKNESSDPEMNDIVKKALLGIPAEAVFTYPNLDTLYRKIALSNNIPPENILITSGSDGAIRACFESCISPGDKLILTRPTFAMYEVYSKIYGANVTWLDYEPSDKGPFLSLENIINTIEEVKPKMFCLPNPDSPTGTVFSLDDLENIIKVAKDNSVLVLIDEAYYPLYPFTVVNLIEKYNNLLVTRSFSKAWGAAGLRVGYILSNSELISLIHKQKPMYEIGNVSVKALEILLDYEDEMKLSVERLNSGKKYFQESMNELGFSTYESHGNFVHVKFGKYAEKIHDFLNDKVYYRKDFNVPSLKGYSRFSTTTIDRFESIVNSIKTIVNQSKKV
jgi:histidinol-phosphate aminotransferase